MLKRNRYSQAPEPLKYAVREESPTPPPFRVNRTWTGKLPIYREFKNRRLILFNIYI
jgi:hypothetical protein